MATDTSPDTLPGQPPAGRAIRQRATRAVWRRRQRGPWILLGGSLALVVVSYTSFNLALGGSERLAAVGLTTTGAVVEVRGPPRWQLFDSGSVVVAYQIEQEPEPRQAVVRLNDESPTYQVGDQVAVLYDPADPALVTIRDEENEPPLLVGISILTMVLGGYGVPGSFFWWLGGRRLHYELARTPWRAYAYLHTASTYDQGEGSVTIRYVAVEGEVGRDGRPLLLLISPLSGITGLDREAWRPTGTLWLAGDSRRRRKLIVGLPVAEGIQLYRARALLDDRRRERAQAALAEAAQPPQ